MSDPRLIVGLDFAEVEEARRTAETLDELVCVYKIGLTQLAGDGLQLSRELKRAGKQVFQDWKLHDIGAQVEGAARAIAANGCDFITVHAEPQVMEAAVRGRGDAPLKILAVTVLTSLGPEALQEIGYALSVQDLVERRVRQAVESGCDGVVASPREAALARRIGGPDFLVVTPGVRPAGASLDDQVRVATPAAALGAGASHLVVARPVIRAADPRAAARRILAEMA
ncbi:MAG: orotidine-5'-phosphate decarboxylase [Proteobacteria bacterium]|nr:orotidine-5'-phosphate decarboxylase [Pseudomonadota bacterium]MBW3616375.1 orotidine-5'-phosphate decarboxylase [Pseudomonadota bacterium]